MYLYWKIHNTSRIFHYDVACGLRGSVLNKALGPRPCVELQVGITASVRLGEVVFSAVSRCLDDGDAKKSHGYQPVSFGLTHPGIEATTWTSRSLSD